MKKLFIIAIIAGILSSCGESTNTPKGLVAFDACSCATVQDMNSEDYKKCKELRANAQFEADYQKCKLAASSGITDTSRVSIGKIEDAKDLKSAEAGTYAIDITNSQITWIGQKVTGKKHTGSIQPKSGTLVMNGGSIVSGELVIDMNTINDTDLSGESKTKLETHLKSDDFFGVAKFPEAKYVITSATAKNAIQYEVTGNLTIKGITKPVTCNLVVSPNGNNVNVGGGFQFDRSLFDVRYGSDTFFDNLGDDMIENNIIVTLDLKGNKK